MFAIEYLEMYLLVVLCNSNTATTFTVFEIEFEQVLGFVTGFEQDRKIKVDKNLVYKNSAIISDVEPSRFVYHGCQ